MVRLLQRMGRIGSVIESALLRAVPRPRRWAALEHLPVLRSGDGTVYHLRSDWVVGGRDNFYWYEPNALGRIDPLGGASNVTSNLKSVKIWSYI